MDESTRAYIYRVAVVVLPLLVVFGLASEEVVLQITSVLGALLVPALAVKNTSTKKK